MTTTPRRALIVIDVQNEYVTGNLRIEYPPIDTSLANIGHAMDVAHAAGVPVIVVQNRTAPTAALFAHGSDGWALHDVVASRPRDHYVEKTLPSAFTETHLETWLKSKSIDTLTVVGYMTHNCDASTVFDAVHRGLTVEFLSDATGAVPYRNEAGYASAMDIHRVFSVVMHSRFAAVVTTQMWAEAVRAGKVLARSNIHASNQQALSQGIGAN